jgi:membrane protease YdiL (CAAX protease family)
MPEPGADRQRFFRARPSRRGRQEPPPPAGRTTGTSRGAWQRVPIDAIPVRHGRRELAWGIGYALFYIVAAVVVGLAIRSHPAPIWGAARFNQDYWYVLVLKIGLLLVVPVVALRWAGYRPEDFLLGWGGDRQRVLRLPLAYALGVVVNMGHLAGIREALESGSASHPVARIGVGILLPLFTAGLPEEIVFRGFLQTRLEAATGRLAAIAITAFLFAAWHLPTRYLLSHGVEGEAGSLISILAGTGLPVFLAGLLLGLAWDRWRNLPTLVAIHWGVDTLPAVASFLMIRF